ncbi:lipopolysaccharide-induced tumor necrosis factor-alpha factor homolog [Anopheles coustani]|uniref:lipopolysaccharide-induced tumor necrosis factor-alpha factor homolog n=1 Tax=Anopheles coustani TaxID=139045 RepID=UPI00265A59B4|nr:lipopolysaccharide-induced tumor necrosis factor-alpha factor homolog [Anopheles coustani]
MATVVLAPGVGPESTRMVCPSCRAEVMTKTELRSNTRTHIYAILLCVFLCWPCVCLPYCCASCRDTVHKCPQCNAYIGVYNR